MAIDATQVRLDTAERLREQNNLVLVHRAVYTGDKRTGTTPLQTYGVVDRVKPTQVNGSNLLGGDLFITLAALVWDPEQSTWTDPLDLVVGDVLEANGERLRVVDPGGVEPTGTAIIFEALARNAKETP
jgi:hypothetical protein